jgi:hypothetical protein
VKRETPISGTTNLVEANQNNLNVQIKDNSAAMSDKSAAGLSDVKGPTINFQNSAPLNYHGLLDSSKAEGVQRNHESLLKRAPKLLLSIIEGTAFPQDTKLKITTQGIQNVVSQRLQYMNAKNEEVKGSHESDMTTYFGSYSLNDVEANQILETNKLNDVLLPKSEGFGRRHFMI